MNPVKSTWTSFSRSSPLHILIHDIASVTEFFRLLRYAELKSNSGSHNRQHATFPVADPPKSYLKA